MVYQYRCENVACSGYGQEHEREHPMRVGPAPEVCPICGSMLRSIITGGVGIIFKGSGWTEKFGKAPIPPYDPEKDMESVDRQRRQAGMEPSDWKPKKAVHPIRSIGVDMRSTKKGSA